MSPRARVFALVALATAVASGIVVIGVIATRTDVPKVEPRKGAPPLALDLGVRTDPEASALRRAESSYDHGGQTERRRAEAIFSHYHSLEAEVGATLAAWPNGTVERLETLAAEHPRSGLVALHLGLALYWSSRDHEAQTAWRAAATVQPDSLYAVRANDLLHPRFAPGLPTFVPSFQAPVRIRVLAPSRQVAALEQAAQRGGAHAKILYGVALQRLDRPVSAERQFAAAARESPNDPEARAAAAVGRFDKSNPSAAFSRLGPLVRVFPHAQTVRFHLGLLLLWMAEIGPARNELRQALAEGPDTTIGRQASAYLQALRRVGTS